MNKADQARLDAIHAMPCICCELFMMTQPFITEAHHIVDGGYRKHSGGHQSTLPLCGWHHRGQQKESYSKEQMECVFGPWLKQRAKFRAWFGTERELLEKTNAKLGLAA